jgi:hypothetical protein
MNSAFLPAVRKRPYGSAYMPGDDETPDNIPGDFSPHVTGTVDSYAPNRSRTGGANAVSPGAGINPAGAYSPNVPSADPPAGTLSPPRSRPGDPDAAGASNPVFLPNPPSLGQTSAQPNLIRDVYAPELQDVSQRLESAYEAPRPGLFRQVAGALLSRRNPALGGLVSGETQRQRTIEPLQQQYGLIAGQIGAQRAATSADIENQLKVSQTGLAVKRQFSGCHSGSKGSPHRQDASPRLRRQR